MSSEMDHPKRQQIASLVAALSGRWTVSLLLTMRDGPKRVSELRRQIPEASKKMLIESLQRLQRDGLVQRYDLSRAVRHVEYEIRLELREPLLELLSSLESFPLDQMDPAELKACIANNPR